MSGKGTVGDLYGKRDKRDMRLPHLNCLGCVQLDQTILQSEFKTT